MFFGLKIIDRMLVNCKAYIVSQPVHDLHELQIAAFVQKVIHHANEMPSVFRDYFILINGQYEYHNRYEDNIQDHVNETTNGQRMIRYERLIIK
jgi:hypothetical protein